MSATFFSHGPDVGLVVHVGRHDGVLSPVSEGGLQSDNRKFNGGCEIKFKSTLNETRSINFYDRCKYRPLGGAAALKQYLLPCQKNTVHVLYLPQNESIRRLREESRKFILNQTAQCKISRLQCGLDTYFSIRRVNIALGPSLQNIRVIEARATNYTDLKTAKC